LFSFADAATLLPRHIDYWYCHIRLRLFSIDYFQAMLLLLMAIIRRHYYAIDYAATYGCYARALMAAIDAIAIFAIDISILMATLPIDTY
jgi:hypothetical protein